MHPDISSYYCGCFFGSVCFALVMAWQRLWLRTTPIQAILDSTSARNSLQSPRPRSGSSIRRASDSLLGSQTLSPAPYPWMLPPASKPHVYCWRNTNDIGWLVQNCPDHRTGHLGSGSNEPKSLRTVKAGKLIERCSRFADIAWWFPFQFVSTCQCCLNRGFGQLQGWVGLSTT